LSEIEKILNFIVEIEKLKGILRKTMPVGFERFENSAEHSWHVCISALMLKEYANDEVDIDRVIRMLLIHDLCEIDAGDTIVYSSDSKLVKEKEYAGMKRVLSLLPSKNAIEYEELWLEFESGDTPESIYARAIDRIPPILHNLYGGGISWRENGITQTQIIEKNSCIGKGSDELWSIISAKLDTAFEEGILCEQSNKNFQADQLT